MNEPWVRVPRFRPRPSAQKALVFTLGLHGILFYPLRFVLVTVCNLSIGALGDTQLQFRGVPECNLPFGALDGTRIQYICVPVSNSPFGALGDTRLQLIRLPWSNLPLDALEKSRLQLKVVSLGPRTYVLSTVYYLLYKILHWFKALCGEEQMRSLGSIVYIFVSGCRVKGNASSAGREVQGAVQEVELHRHDPQPHSSPPRKKLVPLELDEDVAEEEGGEGQRRFRSVLTHPPASGFHAPWTMPFTMFQFGLKNVIMQTCQGSQQSHGHPCLFSVRDCSLRKPRVRWREQWPEQASLQRTMHHTQTRVHPIHMHVQWWRSNHPPPWMLKPIVWLFWLFWRPLFQSQDVGTVVTVCNVGQLALFFGSIYVVVCVSVMLVIMYVGSSLFVSSSLASAGIGILSLGSSFIWVLVWGQWTVS